MKKIAILLCCIALLFIGKIHGQTACANSDFSMGNFTDWTGSVGEHTSAGNDYTVQISSIVAGTVNTGPYIAGQQTIQNAPRTDPNTNNMLSVLPPGYTTSCMLGNAQCQSCDGSTYPQAAQLNYLIAPVTAANCIFTYQYAVVLQNPVGHTTAEMPKFTINVLDATGTQIGGACGTYTVIAHSGLPGYTECLPDPSACSSDSVLWKQWTTVTMDLSPWITQNVTVQFTAFDCTPGGHFGYAYIRCQCGALQCTQQCTGTSVILSAPPGFASYQWQQTGGPATQSWTITPIPPAGTVYSCLLTSIGGCQFTVYDTLHVSPVVVTPSSATICEGQTATITATGGGTYIWSNGLGTNATANPAPTTTTTYTVTVTEAGGCSGSANATVTVNTAVADAGPPSTICPGSSATLDASGSTGSGPLSYHWTTGGTTAQIVVSPTVTTPYTVTVTSNGCTSSATVTVTVSNTLVVSAMPDTTICPSQTVQLTATGATTYVWSPAGTLSSSTGTTVIASPTAPTTVYTVTGSSGTCTASGQVTINVVNTLNLAISNDTTVCPSSTVQLIASGAVSYLWNTLATTGNITVNPATTTTYTVTGTSAGCTASKTVTVTVSNNLPVTVANEAICPGGTTTLTAVSGATSYTWSPAATLSSSTGSPVTATPTVTTTYTVTGTNGGCSGTTSATVTINPNPTIALLPANPAICPGASTTLQASGASTYVWSPTGTLSSSTGITVTANPITTTPYTITGTDANGCTGTNTITVNVTPLTASATETDENCNQGNGTATAAAGGYLCTSTLTYIWNNGENTQTATNLIAGAYIVTVSCGACTATATTNVNNLPGPTVTATSTTSTCGYANGGAIANSTGTNPPYSYLWSNGQSGANLTNVVANTYHVTATDAIGCTATTSVTVGNIPGPTANISGIHSANCGMSNGSATLNISGGTPAYTPIIWSNGETSQNILNVPTGTYCVTVTDANGCTTSVCVTIPQLPGPVATHSYTDEICQMKNGTATAVPSGGVPPYIYSWSNGENTQTATGLSNETYTYTVTDQGGCSTSGAVYVGEIPGPTAYNMYNPKILTFLEGPVYFWDESYGGTQPYTYQWDFGDASSGTGTYNVHPYPNLGTYVITEIVTDSNGCKDTIVDTVKVVDIFTFYIPNAFTPNNDGVNDTWCPKGTNVDTNNYVEYIYDRWGNLIFQTNEWDIINKDPDTGHAKPWNGTVNNKGTINDVVMDVYVYKIELREFNNGPKHSYVGRITLVP
ncbi:MAG: gliding motility-associated C-terminal domain-containing protein [Bacteroidales bacterium]|jgi:gliding motility-associated-like protein